MRYLMFVVLLLSACSAPYHLSGGPDADLNDSGAATSLCGNGVLDPGEQCDRFAFDGLDCSDLGFDLGALSCSPVCTAVTTKRGYLPATEP